MIRGGDDAMPRANRCKANGSDEDGERMASTVFKEGLENGTGEECGGLYMRRSKWTVLHRRGWHMYGGGCSDFCRPAVNLILEGSDFSAVKL